MGRRQGNRTPQNRVHSPRAAPLPSPPRPSLHSPETQSAIPVPISQEGAEQTELLGTGGCDAQDRAMRAGRGGVSAHSAEAAPGGAAEAQEAAHQLLTGATPLKLLPLLCGSFPGGRKPRLADRCGGRVSGKGSLALGTAEETWGSLGMSEPDLTVNPGASFRSWLPRMALATWMWVKWSLLVFPPRSSFPSVLPVGEGREGEGRKIGLQHRQPLHLPPLRFVPEGPTGRCPRPPGRGAAQVRKLGVPISPGLVIPQYRAGR